ncbi:hypothetical protein AADZ90_017545 [Aestuariibius sp. 2305UL40-4]|uniref:hypothetical protein n=1 Tax=Aestuariibius violaceus TaxID=3234132 RepID=UPI00345E39F8
MTQPVLMILRPSPPRRYLAYGCLLFLGVLLVYLAFVGASGLGHRTLLVAFGVGALVTAEALRRATSKAIVLTNECLEEEGTGRVIAQLDEIERVDRGLFAFKPSNGFSIRLTKPRSRAWVLGLWWRSGRHVGIGGVTPKPAATAMAEMIAARLPKR